MKATGVVHRVEDLGRIAIPKEIRRVLRIREGNPSHTTLTPEGRFCMAIHYSATSNDILQQKIDPQMVKGTQATIAVSINQI